MSELTTVAKTDDIAPGSGMVAEVNGRSIAVFNVEGSFFAMDNTCVHRGGPLGEGDLDGDIVTCPWHGWEYSVKTGVCVNTPSASVSCFPVTVEDSEVKVQLS